MNSFSHSRYFYSTSSSPLLLKSTTTQRCSRLQHWYFVGVNTPKCLSLTGICEWKTYPRSYVAAGVGFKPATLQTQGTELTTELPHPTMMVIQR